jgi:hypothetical protein
MPALPSRRLVGGQLDVQSKTLAAARNGKAARVPERPFLSDAWLSCAWPGELAPEIGCSHNLNVRRVVPSRKVLGVTLNPRRELLRHECVVESFR